MIQHQPVTNWQFMPFPRRRYDGTGAYSGLPLSNCVIAFFQKYFFIILFDEELNVGISGALLSLGLPPVTLRSLGVTQGVATIHWIPYATPHSLAGQEEPFTLMIVVFA